LREREGLREQKEQIQILFLGHTGYEYAIIPKAMPYRSYNLAEPEGELVANYILNLQVLSMIRPHLKIVVLPLINQFFNRALEWLMRPKPLQIFLLWVHHLFKTSRIIQNNGFTVVRQKLESFSPMLDRGDDERVL